MGESEREREGLYRMRVAETVTSLTTRVGEESVLWHHRFEHPSHRVISLLPGVTIHLNIVMFATALNKPVNVFQTVQLVLVQFFDLI